MFDEAWYLERNPDLQGASLDAWQHYLAHGHAEGREPGPDFNTAWYLEQCVEARESGMPALLHYHQSGRHTGYDVGNPTFAGDLQQRPGRPTVLLCAHAANVQLFGAERNLLDTLDACAVLHLNVLVSVPSVANPAYIDALRARAMQVVCIPTQLWRADIAPCRVAVERFCALIRNHSVDLVHSNTLMLREPLIAARLAQVPAVLHAHESPRMTPTCVQLSACLRIRSLPRQWAGPTRYWPTPPSRRNTSQNRARRMWLATSSTSKRSTCRIR
ncbi:hypothetical protein QJS63_14755 [Pseudomonas juntendi]|nr:hypothetical protein QJS63_14755 [Pseudomonas juntendi]